MKNEKKENFDTPELQWNEHLCDHENLFEPMRVNYNQHLAQRFSKSKQSAMIGCLQTQVCKQPIISLYFELETVLKFYNLEA